LSASGTARRFFHSPLQDRKGEGEPSNACIAFLRKAPIRPKERIPKRELGFFDQRRPASRPEAVGRRHRSHAGLASQRSTTSGVDPDCRAGLLSLQPYSDPDLDQGLAGYRELLGLPIKSRNNPSGHNSRCSPGFDIETSGLGPIDLGGHVFTCIEAFVEFSRLHMHQSLFPRAAYRNNPNPPTAIRVDGRPVLASDTTESQKALLVRLLRGSFDQARVIPKALRLIKVAPVLFAVRSTLVGVIIEFHLTPTAGEID
jgi:hypothetical protein